MIPTAALLARTRRDSAAQMPLPGSLPISQLIMPTVSLLAEPMMAQWIFDTVSPCSEVSLAAKEKKV